MTCTERINKFLEEFKNESTKVLCEIYNESSEGCLFNNCNAGTRAYAMMKAAEEILVNRNNECYYEYSLDI